MGGGDASRELDSLAAARVVKAAHNGCIGTLAQFLLLSSLVAGQAAAAPPAECYAQCSVALGDDSAVGASIYDNCLRLCANRAPAPAPGIWGAIALSQSTLLAGSSYNYQSQKDAGQRALQECHLAMNAMRDCAILGSFANACAALATSPSEHAWGFSGSQGTLALATAAASSQCAKGGARACSIVAEFCTPNHASAPTDAAKPTIRGPPAPVAVDPMAVGTWELATDYGRWMWTINAAGTYQFHTEAPNASDHSGTFAANAGRWSLRATAGFAAGYSDGGSYEFQSPDAFVVTGKLGTATWHRIITEPPKTLSAP